MPETTMILVDNGLSSQNQDYLPSRFILQKETIETIISQKLEENQENLVGIIPMCQPQFNDILTPTKQRTHINTFLNKIGLYKQNNLLKGISQASYSFNQRDVGDKVLIIFLGCEIEESVKNEFFARVYELLTYGITIKIIFFAESMHLADVFKKQIEFTNFSCFEIKYDQDFTSAVISNISDLNEYEDDPELAEAIRLSLQDQKK